MISTLTTTEEAKLIDGPAGKLEIAVGKINDQKSKAWGIVCHPHPLFGGTMYNKVVTTLVKTFQALSVNTVRFNFRGIGKSEGQFDNGVGELEDLLTIIKWLEKEFGKHELWLAGFSFGAYIAALAATQISVKKLVTIAPPVEHFPMQILPAINNDWVLVQGEKDEVVPAEKVLAWAESRYPKPIILDFPEADHFFHGQLQELRTRLEEALKIS